jgi:hypothetical protein
MEFRSILKQKERELREDLDFIKYWLDWSEQEIIRLHAVIKLCIIIGL